MAGIELYKCANIESTVSPVYTNKTVSGNFRGPEFPQGFFGIQSMMDDVAYKMKMDPVEFGMKNMTRTVARQGAVHRTTRSRNASTAARRSSTGRAAGGRSRDPIAGPIKRGAGFTYMAFRSGVGSSSAVLQLDARGKYTLFVGVTDVGAGAKTTMGIIAAEELGVPLSQVDVVWGDTDRCPFSVGESGSRTTIMTGYAAIRSRARSEEADRREGHADRHATSWWRPRRRSRVMDGQVRNAFGAHFVEVEVDTELGHVRITKYTAVHDCGRIMNPLTATSQIQGAAHSGHRHGAAREPALRRAHRSAAHARLLLRSHPDASRRAADRSHVHRERRRVRGRAGRRAWASRASSCRPAPSATRSSTRSASRMKDLPITRDKILGALA